MTAFIKPFRDGWGILYPDPGGSGKLIESTQRFDFPLEAFNEAHAMGYAEVEKWAPQPKGRKPTA